MSDSTMSFSDITVRTVRSRPGEHPAQIVEAIDAVLERLKKRWPELAWEIPYVGPWSGPVEERQRLVASRVAGDVDEHAVPERGAAFGLTAAQGGVPMVRVKPRGRLARVSGWVLGAGSRCRRGASRRCRLHARTW